MTSFPYAEDIIPHMLNTWLNAMAHKDEASLAARAEIDLLASDLGLTPFSFTWKKYREATMPVLDELFHTLHAHNAYDDQGICPYIFFKLDCDDLILVHYGLAS